MICSVRWLDTESHTVRLLFGSADDGITNGKSANPAVSTTPATASDDRTKAGAAWPLDEAKSATSAPPMPAMGATIVHGYSTWSCNQPDGPCTTVFASG